MYICIYSKEESAYEQKQQERMVGTEVNMPNNKQNEFPAKNTHTNMLDMWFWNVPIEFHLQPHVACWSHFVVGCRKSWSYHHCISICGCGLMWLNKRKLCLSSSSWIIIIISITIITIITIIKSEIWVSLNIKQPNVWWFKTSCRRYSMANEIESAIFRPRSMITCFLLSLFRWWTTHKLSVVWFHSNSK